MKAKAHEMMSKLWGEGRWLWPFSVALTLLYGVLFVMAEFYDMPCNGFSDFMGLAFQWAVVEFAVLGLLLLISVSRHVFAVAFPLLTVACTAMAYYRYTVKVTLTPMVIDLALVNDARTSLDVVSAWLVLLIVLAAVASFFIVRWRFSKGRLRLWYAHAVAALLMIYVPINVPAAYNAIVQRVPYSIFYSTKEYLDARKEVAAVRPYFKGKATCGTDSLTVVFVLGESVRSANLQINGYERATTPLLCKENNAVSLPNVTTDYGFTHTSVPHLLTRSDEKHPNRAYTERSFVSLMRQAGYSSAWIANQEQVSTFIYFMKECDTLVYVNGGKSLYIYDKWLDEDVLEAYDNELRKPNPRKLILLHTIGSHWWYNAHYAADCEAFKPVVKSKIISSNTPEEMRNSYDNTIVYSDRVWHSLIDRLRKKNAVLIYLSDHGECLGEDGYFTHGTDRPPVHRPACFVWYSDEFARRYPQKVEALRANKDKSYKSYFLFHSILEAADISSGYIEKRLNIFKK